MIKISFSLLLLSTIFSCTAQTTDSNQLVDPSNSIDENSIKLDSSDIHFQFRGRCTAFNSKKNDVPSNGEAHSQNLASKTDSKFEENRNYLFLNTDEYLNNGNGLAAHKLYLVNTTKKKVEYAAQDSRLYIVAQALDSNGVWNAISYLPSSWCGNSYHTLTLGKNEYWSFNVPVFKGTFETKLRYVLTRKDEHQLVSNEIDVRINPDQFNTELKQGHTPTGLMDSYDD
ncbi:MAG: hypothetical protein COA38_01665 [Fluviicola sp.]|nr:MAG: hypothetical protein COA38_01665 [Fluviicola sp.]